MTIEEKQQEIIEEFNLGKDLPLIAPEYKTEDRLIEGCQSRVWLHSEFKNNLMEYTADSDAIITKGIIGLLIQVMNKETPESILKTDLHFIKDIGLQDHLSPTRANGLVGMVKRIKTEALKHIKN